jgi:AcrR family transcriptional regulator
MTTATSPTPLRRDAAANRERILAAAVEVFGTDGVRAGIDDIAKRAGVGVGTVYRRFPTKEALVQAIVAQLLADLVVVARSALEAPPTAGLAEFLTGAGELQARHAGSLWLLWSSGDECEQTVAELRAIVQQLLTRAQHARAVRHDLAYEDVVMVLWSLAGVVESARDVDPQLWRRTLEVLLLGLRPSSDSLHHPPLRSGGLDDVSRQTRARRASQL